MHLKRLTLPIFGAAVLLTLGLGTPVAQAAPAQPKPPVPHNDVFPGSRPGSANVGPLATPQARVRALAATAVPNNGFTCDGTDGPRVEVLYVREPNMPDRLTQLMPVLQAWLINVDAAYNDGAARTGDSRHIRYLTETVGGTCQAVVRNVTVPAGSLTGWANSTSAVRALGYDKPQRKYLMITEGNEWCGGGETYGDDRPGADNLNNTATAYARVDILTGCLGANSIAHELGHVFGAVQASAPHAVEPGHCNQRFDLMCYNPQSTSDCLEWDTERLPDCNSDDYFNTRPAAGSYLATHWNIANSVFLRAGTTVDNQHYPRPGRAYTIRSKVTGEALDVQGGAGGGPLAYLNTAPSSGATTQQWLMGYKTGILLINRGSQLCADTAYSGLTPGTKTLQYPCTAQNGMHWAYMPHADGSYSVLNWLNGLALTQSGSTVDQQVYTGAPNQRWTFTALADPGIPVETSYTVRGFETRSPVGVTTPAQPGSPAVTGGTGQVWKLREAGVYRQLVHVPSGLCATTGANTADGAPVVLATCGTANEQQWRVRWIANRTVMMINRRSGLALTTNGAGSGLTQGKLNIDAGTQVFFVDKI